MMLLEPNLSRRMPSWRDPRSDFALIGGGIVGLATAQALLERFPGASLTLIEKEDHWAAHQSGHNSGVIHSGVYYRPGSEKARFCTAGNRSMVAFCEANGIAYERCGKVIVATETAELPRLESLFQRAEANRVTVERLHGDAVREREPNVRAVAGMRVPDEGIVHYPDVCRKLAERIADHGATLETGTELRAIHRRANTLTLETNRGVRHTRFLINCAGLHSDRIARMAGCEPNVKIVPFRGEYYELVPEKRSLVRHLVYPVPNPDFPFLGVHLTRMMDGSVHVGPNAVLGLKREGYEKTDFDGGDLLDTLTYPGFWRLAARHFREGAKEMVRSVSKSAFVQNVQRLLPVVEADDLLPTHAGVRAQALHPDGSLVDDFLFVESADALHVCNAPSPAATCSLEIGKTIAARVAVRQGSLHR